jgi:hypothetical protein
LTGAIVPRPRMLLAIALLCRAARDHPARERISGTH